MGRGIRLATEVVVLLALLAGPPVSADDAQPPVRYVDGRLTLRVERAPIADVLRRIGDATGAVVRGDIPFGEVTVALENVPLSVALDTMLGSHSFMLTYGAHGALRSIDLLGAGPAITPAPAATPAAGAVAVAARPLAAEEAQAGILQREVPAWGDLKGAFGTETITVGRLLHAVTDDQRPEVRAAARESILDTFLQSPEVEAAYLSTLAPVDDATLANMLRGRNVDGVAEDWFAAVAMRARSPELKQKAAAVLQALRSPPAP